MLDLTEYSDDLMIARGLYSTVRAAHEDEKKELAILCGAMISFFPQILRAMQPGKGEEIYSVAPMLDNARVTLDKIERCTDRLESLAAQRAELRMKAW